MANTPRTVALPEQIEALGLTSTFAEPGEFPKFLVKINDVLVFLDQTTITRMGISLRDASHCNWELNKQHLLTLMDPTRPKLFPSAPEHPHTGEPLKFCMISSIRRPKILQEIQFMDQVSAIRRYDSGSCHVEFGPYVLDQYYRVWQMSQRHRHHISDLADEESASK